MSLLSNIRGNPRTVWALWDLLLANGHSLTEGEVYRWIGERGVEIGDQSLVGQTLNAALDLKLIKKNGDVIQINPQLVSRPANIKELNDYVHEYLSTLDLNASQESEVFEILARYIVCCEIRDGFNWLAKTSREDLADELNRGISGTMNSTRMPRWNDWMVFLGLGLELPGSGNKKYFYPFFSERMKRELYLAGGELPRGKPIKAAQFLSKLRQRMPYLDGGKYFTHVSGLEANYSPSSLKISEPFSRALIELEIQECITLKAKGDAQEVFQLSSGKDFSYVTISK